MPDTVISSKSISARIESPNPSRADEIDCQTNTQRHAQGAYDNPFAPDNVYGHAVALLSRHPVKSEGALHIDIGCGFGRIAEPLVAALGVTYLGCDLDENALGSLAERGFETHRLVLDTEARIYQALVTMIAGRKLASISIIDTLEHLDDPAATMRALSRIAGEYQAFVLISVPNTAHRDLGLRLLFGLWDYTETGILDHTHRTLFSNSVLRRMLAGNGLHIVDANDVKMAASDQAYPSDHPALQSGTILHRLLCELRDLGDDFGTTNQMVRLCTAGPKAVSPPFDERSTVSRPLMSVVIRSEGRQPDLLTEVMTCLAGQTMTDFEILILGHQLDRQCQVEIERVIVELPDWLAKKTRFLRIDQGNKTDLLNAGFAVAAGRYIGVLEEHDVIFAHWAASFLHAAEVAPGQILRCNAVTQNIRRVEYNFATGIRAEAGLLKAHPSEFDLFEQAHADCSPLACLAFPRGLFHGLRLGFDPSLKIFAGWDYLLRGAAYTGVTSEPGIIAIHREWEGEKIPGGEDRVEIERMKVVENFGALATPLWPAGSIDKLRHSLAGGQDRAAETARQASAQQETAIAAAAEVHEHLRALTEVISIYGSASWRVTAPLRILARLARRGPMNAATACGLSTKQLNDLSERLRISRSWRITRKLRERSGSGPE